MTASIEAAFVSFAFEKRSIDIDEIFFIFVFAITFTIIDVTFVINFNYRISFKIIRKYWDRVFVD